MNNSSRGTWRVNEDGSFTCLARVTNEVGTLVTQATVDSIAVTVTQQSDDDESVANTDATPYTASPAPVVADTIFDTAQTSTVMWPTAEHPEGGYNFRHTLPPAAVPTGDAYYNAEYTLTMTSGVVIQLLFQGIYAVPLLKS